MAFDLYILSSDLYNWKAQNVAFSKDPQDLINLLETFLFTQATTCLQLLGVLFTTKEKNRILENARKLVPGPTGAPIADPLLAMAAFPVTHPYWDFNMAEGKESLHIYRRALLAGLKAVAHKPINKTKICNVKQERDESPAVDLERLMGAFKQYSRYDPESGEAWQVIILAYVNHQHQISRENYSH